MNIKNDNQKFYSKLELVNEINFNYDTIERILIPINIPYIRMNTGLPIFIDWKHHAFKYDEIIMWKKRIDLAQKFYQTSIFEKQKVKNRHSVAVIIGNRDYKGMATVDFAERDADAMLEFIIKNMMFPFSNTSIHQMIMDMYIIHYC